MRPRAVSLVVMLMMAVAAPGFAWGPMTQQAIVSTAVHVISQEGVAQLAKLERDVRDGASVSPEVMTNTIPSLAAGPVRAIEAEMHLLDTVRGNAVDAYFAYRLGVLGVLVAQITAPLANENPTERDRYYADIEKNVQQAPLKPSPRKVVDPQAYFERVQRLANARNDLIVKDYQEGAGFLGIAKASMAEDVSRSVDAVADVWKTILTRNVKHASISDAQLQEYVLAAFAFYIKRGSEPEIDTHYRRLVQIARKTPDMAKRIGDMFYQAEMFERAIKEYEEVLAVDPQRKDVTAKIADYYVKAGDEALAKKRLQPAYDAYAKAAQTDRLHPTAEGKRLEVERLIAERDARLEATRRNIEDAAALQTQGEQLALQHRFADAMSILAEAQAKYESVGDEFPTELQAANAGLANVDSRLSELKGELIQNAQGLTGSGFASDFRQLAETSAGNLDEQALRALVANQLATEIGKLRSQYQEALKIK